MGQILAKDVYSMLVNSQIALDKLGLRSSILYYQECLFNNRGL